MLLASLWLQQNPLHNLSPAYRFSTAHPLAHPRISVLTPLSALQIVVNSPNVEYKEDEIISKYYYEKNTAEISNGKVSVTPSAYKYTFRTKRKVGAEGSACPA